MIKPFLSLCACLLFLLGAETRAADDPALPTIAGRYVIDVRTQVEWQKAHIAGAIWIPHDVIGRHIEALLPDRRAPIGLYCGSGRRAGIALTALQAMGYENLENLGGMEDAQRKLE